MKIENKNVRRNFFWGDGRFYTTDIVNKRAGVMIKNVSKEEFTITLENGIRLSSNHFSAIVREEGDKRIEVSFIYPSIRLRLIFESRDDVLSKQLVLESSTEVIKSVEVESFEFETEDHIFYPKRQDCIKEMANFSGYYVELGQPVYANSLFLGMEFPMSENKVDCRHYVSRYYLGTVINQEKILWPCIVGGADSYKKEEIQEAFFEYVEGIAQPSYFRKQYNSWYDHMTDITEEGILKSFSEIRDGFENHGVHLDAYVVDDGWTNYQSVWEFNHKFPNGLRNIKHLVNGFGSSLGLWIGPRGGYNGTEIIMSDWLEAHPELRIGSKNYTSNDVNVADFNYLNQMKKKMLEYQKEFDISYWKIDGWLLQPDKPDKSGSHGMYTMTAVYEFLIQLLIDLRKERGGKDCWLNLTSYVNPSPWFLQWVNSLWIQISQDVGFTENAGNDINRMITYRDIQYQEFLEKREIQLPMWSLYNHEPIYAVSANTWYMDHQMFASIPDFEAYLLFISTRGNAFWEFHYSFDMFDEERWEANARAVKWIEENYQTLKYSKKIGGSPEKFEIYGYKCHNQKTSTEILSLRNPAQIKQKIKIENLSIENFTRVIGDFTIQEDEIELAPYSIVILKK